MLTFVRVEKDEQYMLRCFQLAQLGAGSVAPNPMVGAVLVYDGRIIGEGFHRRYGEAHAEVNCLNSVAEDDKQYIGKSVLYVSLEPCAHFGKTPPCADLVIRNRIPQVVIGCTDPFEKVNGSGINKLQQAGVKVMEGILRDEAVELNRRFFTFHAKKRPYIILKWAQSSDAKIASKDSGRLKISNEITDKLVHKWRSEEAAIAVGFNTARYDDPSLTTRLWTGKNPLRIVVDEQLELSPNLKLFDRSTATIVVNRVKEIKGDQLSFCMIKPGESVAAAFSRILYELNIQSVIVEGGAKMLNMFIEAGLWDEARIITNTSLYIGEGLTAPILQQHDSIETINILSDEIKVFRNNPAGKL